MPLATAQVQVRDLVMGPGTLYTLDQDVNPFVLSVRADQGGPRAWNHGTWSGAEWAAERVVPLRVTLTAADMPGWVAAFQALAAAFAPAGDTVQQSQLRFEIGGGEYVLFGRPRMVEPDTTLLGSFSSQVRLSFVAQDPRIYSGAESTTGAITLPTQAGGLLVPDVAATTPPYGLVLSEVAGDYASTPDTAALDITGDLDLRCAFFGNELDTLNQAMVGKWETTSGDHRSYLLRSTPGRILSLHWSTDGTAGTAVNQVSTVGMPADARAARATLDVDNGAGQHVVTFFTATSPGGVWTQLGDAVTVAGTTSIHAGAAMLEVGSFDAGTANMFDGTIVAAEVRDGINGTVVAAPDFAAQAHGAASFTGSAGLTWTVNGNATVNGRVVGGGLLVPFSIDSTLVGGTASVVNAGTADTGMMLRVDGPVPQPRIILQRPDGTVQSITFVPGFDLPAGQWIDIDTAARTALLNGLPQASVRGQAAWDMDPYPLQPGTSTLRFGAADVTAGTLSGTWRSAWW